MMSATSRRHIAAGILTLFISAVAFTAIVRADDAQDPTNTYLLSVDDELTISVYGHDDLKADVTVLPDGSINYPEVGAIHAAGMTVQQLENTVATGLTTLNQPKVTIFVRSTKPRKVSIVGAVRSPGIYDLKPGWRVIQAVAACGGAAQAPELTQVTLVTDEGRRTRDLDYIKLMKGDDLSVNPVLKPEDVIVVSQKDPSLAEVQVLGEVSHPGVYAVPPDGASVVSLLAQVGGATPHAAMTRAQIWHQGMVRTVHLNTIMQNLTGGDETERLYAGDVLMIPENLSKIAVLGEVRVPGAYEIPDGQEVSLTAVLAEAGGPTQDANTKGAEILRRGPDGTLTQVPVDVNSLLHGGKEQSITMKTGDVFYMPTKRKTSTGQDIMNQLPGVALITSLLKGGF